MADTWGYEKNNGPSEWHKSFPIATLGTRQSPIDIVTGRTTIDHSLPPLEWKYRENTVGDVVNTGASFMVSVGGQGSVLTGGPLEGTYELLQFHAHWGGDETRGSEHTVDGKAYPAELHLVHWNRSKYESPSEAMEKSDGLAVLGLFIEIEEDPHEELEKLFSQLPQIRYRDAKTRLAQPLNPAKFLPEFGKREYWTYEGSLTTPPLLESVTWIVFKEPMTMSRKQLSQLCDLCTCHQNEGQEASKKMVDNYRPTFPIGDRVVKSCR